MSQAGRRIRLVCLQLLEHKLELGNLAIELLRGAAETQTAQPHQLDLQLLDLQRLALERRHGSDNEPLQALDVIGKIGSSFEHTVSFV